MKNFTLYWPELANVHLTKDVGMVPFIMNKYYNYNACIATKSCGKKFPDSEKYLENLPIKYLGTEDDVNDMIENTDVLMVIGPYDFNLNMIDHFKDKNPHGKVFMKTDMNIKWLRRITINDRLINTLKKCTIITNECRSICQLMNLGWNIKVDYIPNGYYDFTKDNTGPITYSEKENTILTVGRIGSYDKANGVLLDAFKLCASKIPDWNLKFVGPIEESFKPYIDNFMNTNPELAQRIEFVGPIYDKIELKKIYRSSKIFCLTSLHEGFPLVFPEAAINGCYIISSFIDCAYDITDNLNYGSIFPINNSMYLANTLMETCNNETKLQRVCDEIQTYCNENFDWIKICGKIDTLLNQ